MRWAVGQGCRRLVEGAATKKERDALHALDGVTVEMWLARQCLTTSAARLGARDALHKNKTATAAAAGGLGPAPRVESRRTTN